MKKTINAFDAVQQKTRARIPGLVGISALLNILLLVSAIYMLQIYDRVLASGSMDTLLWLSTIALFAIAIYGLLEQARRTILTRTGSWIDRELTEPVIRQRMHARLAGVPVAAGPRDVADYRGLYQSDASLALLDAPWAFVFIAFIWALHPVLGMIALGGAAVLFGLTLLNDALTRSQREDASKQRRSVNEDAIRYLEKGETIRPLGMTQRLFKRWQDAASGARSAEQSLTERTTRIMSLSKSIRMGLQVIILGSGAYLVLGGQITAGAMIAASIVLGRALGPIERITGAWRKLMAANSAKKALHKHFTGLDDITPIRLPRPQGRISGEGAFYTPHGAREPILRELTFRIEPGHCVAVVGPSGSGKSSLCRLMVGAWAPTSGHIRIDGAEAFRWSDEELGRHLGYLPQQVEFFPGTVAENIARFSEAKDEEIIAAAQAAGVHELILQLPGGYETDMDPMASAISQGQRQRIGLARALFGDPALVILDEPNSNMDRSGDAALHKAIDALKKAKRTVVIVSHRASILKLSDSVMSMKAGRIQRYGPVESFIKPVQPTDVHPTQVVLNAAEVSS